jgi:hypothetical protein
MVAAIVRRLMTPYLNTEELKDLYDAILLNTCLVGEDGYAIPVYSGLLSGIKLTTVLGTICNIAYSETLAIRFRGDTYQGDDLTGKMQSFWTLISSLRKYKQAGLNVHPAKNRATCHPYKSTEFLRVTYFQNGYY